MTQDELNALSTYRAHRHTGDCQCNCPQCIKAKRILRERQQKMWPIDKASE